MSSRRRFRFLGTGTSVGVPMIGCDCAVCRSNEPRNNRTRSSVLIEAPAGNILLDTGPDLRFQLLREKINRIHAVVYTHQHADHIFGLDDVRVFAHYLEHDLPIYCEPQVEDFIRRAFSYAFDPVVLAFPAGGAPKLAFRRCERPSFHVLDQTLIPIRLEHGRYHVLGYRIGDVAYCTDVNRIPDESWPLLENLDVLIIDALRFTPHPTHFSLDESLAVIERVQPKRALLTHISCRLVPEEAERKLPNHVALAYDGMTFEF